MQGREKDRGRRGVRQRKRQRGEGGEREKGGERKGEEKHTVLKVLESKTFFSLHHKSLQYQYISVYTSDAIIM